MNNFSFNSFPVLETEALLLRRLTPNDDKQIFLIRSNLIMAEHLDRPLCQSIEEAAQFINKITNGIENNKWLYWGLTLKGDNTVIGTICLWQFNEDKTTAEIGYELLPDFQGHGYMQEVVNAIINFGFTKLNLNNIYAEVATYNIKSIKILEKFGFKLNEFAAKEKSPNTLIYELDKSI